MKHLFFKACMTVMLAVAFISCEKVELPNADNNGNPQEDGVSISFTIANIEQVAFNDGVTQTRAAAITSLCSRITFAFFQDDEKIKQVSQKASDNGFGNLTVSLPSGSYKFVVLAHNGTDNPTVTFKNISFEHAAWTKPSHEGLVTLQGGFALIDASEIISIKDFHEESVRAISSARL